MFDMLVKGVFFFSLKSLSRWDIIFNTNLFIHGLDILFSCFLFIFFKGAWWSIQPSYLHRKSPILGLVPAGFLAVQFWMHLSSINDSSLNSRKSRL